MSLTPGSKLSHFEILARIGEGGMGEVYRAHDDKLGRDVAIKVIRADALESSDRRERFVREAKAAAVLNHPNIATVYEIDEVDGLTFVAMELIEGDTLNDLIAVGSLSAERVRTIVIDVAEGLSAAHAKNVVHRDLKPANIMILEDGRAKIIDFGLAKLLEGGSEGETATKAQAIVGTVAYMSPEQARGGEIDHRSDLFSLGIVVHEMLTGRKPFDARNAPETLNAIINFPAPRLPAAAAGWQSTVDRCLAKAPSERYRDAGEFAAALRGIHAGETLRKTRWSWIVAASAAAIVFAVLVVGRKDVADGTPGIANPTLVTRAVGVEDHPAWSPDGTTLAFSATTNPNPFTGNWDVWISQVRGEQPLNRTPDHGGDDRYPSWSPDGSQIAFRSVRNDAGVYVMNALAGGARRVSATAATQPSRPQWSPDGTEIAYTTGDEVAIEILSLVTGESRRIVPQHSQGIFELAWSPDGEYFAFIHARALVAQVTELVLLRISDGAELELTDGLTSVWSPAWRGDSRTLAYVSNRGGPRDLWLQRLDDDGEPNGEPSQITTGVEILSASFTPDGTKVAYSKGRRLANVWRVPLVEDRVVTWSDAEQITHDQAWIEFIALSPDGAELAVGSDRTGEPNLWILPSSGGDMRALTTDPTPDWHPDYSPDGKHIVFYAYRSGNRDVWIVESEGGAARQLTFHEERDSYPTWSPDGARVAFDSWRSGNSDIWVVTLATGEIAQLTTHPGFDRAPTWSPDGRWIAFDRDQTFWRIPADGGEAEPLGPTRGNLARFTPDGRSLLVTNSDDRNIWAIDPDTKSARALTDLSDRPGGLGDVALATDGRYIYFTWIVDVSDIWVADVVDER